MINIMCFIKISVKDINQFTKFQNIKGDNQTYKFPENISAEENN